MEDKLIDILEHREATAQAYIEMSERYNIPIEVFGEKIPIQTVGNLPKQERYKTIRGQIRDFLERNSDNELNWEELYHRLPDKRLRLAVCLEILKDRILENNSQDNTEPAQKNIVLSEAYQLIKEQRVSDLIYREWVSSMMEDITQGPWSQTLELSLVNSIKQALTNEVNFLNSAQKILEETINWSKTNNDSPTKRIEAIKKSFPDFDPNSQKWQTTLMERIQTESIDILKKDLPQTSKVSLEKEPTLLIIGEKHGAKNNSTFLYEILKECKDSGFNSITLEEPRTTGWAFYIEFAQNLSKSINHNPKEIEQVAIKFCSERGLPKKSLAQRLTLIHFARVLGYNITFVDIDENQKKELNSKRRFSNEQAIIDSPPTDTNDPISALGGPKVFADSIVAAYKDCLYRSKEMSKLILEVLEKEKTIHIGGLLHSIDIQEEIRKSLGKTPNVITLDSKKSANSIAESLGKYPKDNPKEGVFKFDTAAQYNSRLLKAILKGEDLDKAKSKTKLAKENNEESDILLN